MSANIDPIEKDVIVKEISERLMTLPDLQVANLYNAIMEKKIDPFTKDGMFVYREYKFMDLSEYIVDKEDK